MNQDTRTYGRCRKGYMRIVTQVFLFALVVMLGWFPRSAWGQLVDPFGSSPGASAGKLVDAFVAGKVEKEAVEPESSEPPMPPAAEPEFPAEWVGAFVAQSQSHVRPKQNKSRCEVSSEERLSIHIGPLGSVTWTGFSYLDMKCPGTNPVPSSCWYEGNGHAVPTNEGLRLETKRTSMAGPSIGTLNVWKCGPLEVVIPNNLRLDRRDCVLIGPREDPKDANVRALLCESSPTFLGISEGLIHRKGKRFLLRRPESRKKWMKLRKLRVDAARPATARPKHATLAAKCTGLFRHLEEAKDTLERSIRSRRDAKSTDDYELGMKATESAKAARRTIEQLSQLGQRCPNKPTRSESAAAACSRITRSWKLGNDRLESQKKAYATATRSKDYGAERIAGRLIRSIKEELKDSKKEVVRCRQAKAPKKLTSREVPVDIPSKCNDIHSSLREAWTRLNKLGAQVDEASILAGAEIGVQEQVQAHGRRRRLVKLYLSAGTEERDGWLDLKACIAANQDFTE